ncbi:hypothetical protein [Xanthomonas euvesicatoria]|uniref:hypothetical protein n=1 Tax=Xanthomonas euvesicatoria TaxID=456327 RepID=UPI003D18D261
MIACAGYSISTDGKTASLRWGMVHPTLHRQCLGTELLLARLEAVRLTPNIQRVVLDTSQHTQAFYPRFRVCRAASCARWLWCRLGPAGYGPGVLSTPCT